MSRAVVNVAVGGQHGTEGDFYPGAQSRLERTLRVAGAYDGATVLWRDGYPVGCEPHSQVPYLFKQAAMSEAAGRYRTLLWLDAVMLALRPVDRVFEEIEAQGYILWSHPLGEWSVGGLTSDECLAHYKVTRGAAYEMPMLCSAVFGYSLDHPLGHMLHESFMAAPALAFRGAWHNRNRVVSKDSRVQGHRHDQSILSILVHKLGLNLSPTPYPAAMYGLETDATVFLHDFYGKKGWA